MANLRCLMVRTALQMIDRNIAQELHGRLMLSASYPAIPGRPRYRGNDVLIRLCLIHNSYSVILSLS